MRIPLLMVRKDLLRKARSPLGLLVVLAFPIMFAGIMALAFGGGGAETPRVHLLVENRDDAFLDNALMSALGSDPVAEHFLVEVVGEEGPDRIEDGKGSALLVIPDRFTEDLVDGAPTRLELVRNPAQGILPEVAEQLSSVLVEVLDSASRVLREPLSTIGSYMEDDAPDMDAATVSTLSTDVFESMQGAEAFLFPPVMELSSVDLGEEETAEEDEDSAGGQNITLMIFLWVFPGISVYALFMVGDLAMRDLLMEADAGTLRRQVQGPVNAGTLLAGKALFAALLSLISLAVLSLVALVAVDGPVSLGAFLLLSLALILAIVGSAAAIYGAAGSSTRGAVVASIVYLIMAFAGGSFIQLSNMPGIIQAIAPVTPFYWGTEGFRLLLQDGGGLAEVVRPVLVLAAIGAGLMILGSVLLQRRLTRGGLA